jgi:hypothetical protein
MVHGMKSHMSQIGVRFGVVSLLINQEEVQTVTILGLLIWLGTTEIFARFMKQRNADPHIS